MPPSVREYPFADYILPKNGMHPIKKSTFPILQPEDLQENGATREVRWEFSKTLRLGFRWTFR